MRVTGMEGYGRVLGCAGGGECSYESYRPFDRSIDQSHELDLGEFKQGAMVSLTVEGPATLCR
jgi:hypothetical protein